MTCMEELEDRLLLHALTLADDVRDDLTAAHRAIRAMERLDLEQLTCVLAALVPPDIPVEQLAWWRVARSAPPVKRPEQDPCGSRKGYRRHLAVPEDACGPCVEANRTYEAERKAAQRARQREEAA